MSKIISEAEFPRYVRIRIAAAGSQRALAAQLNLSESVLSEVANGKVDPSDTVLEALGVRKIVSYEIPAE